MKTVKEILESKNIYKVEKGGDYLVHCLNPEHKDAHPSLRIDKISGKYNCFSCGFKGNIFRLYGLEEPVISTMLLDLVQKIDSMLVQTTGLQIPESAEPFSMEYRNIKASTFEHFGAFTHSDYDGRICIPIVNHLTGKITNILARSLFSNVSPRYLVYPFGVAVPLFPFIKSDTIILVEGIFDLLNLYDKGITNVVCTFGTKLLETNIHDKLNAYLITGTKNICILFDPDEAGLAAEKSLVEKLQKESVRVFKCSSLLLEYGCDPGDLNNNQVEELKHTIAGLIQ